MRLSGRQGKKLWALESPISSRNEAMILDVTTLITLKFSKEFHHLGNIEAESKIY